MPSAGRVLATLREVNATATIAAFLIAVHEEPRIATVSPSLLPLSGGALLQVTFDAPVEVLPSLTLRLDAGDFSADVVLAIDAGGFYASGRSPAALGVANGTFASIGFAVDGRSFLTSGHGIFFVVQAALKICFLYVGEPDDFGWNFQINQARHREPFFWSSGDILCFVSGRTGSQYV
jgi:hypothetical protein